MKDINKCYKRILTLLLSATMIITTVPQYVSAQTADELIIDEDILQPDSLTEETVKEEDRSADNESLLVDPDVLLSEDSSVSDDVLDKSVSDNSVIIDADQVTLSENNFAEDEFSNDAVSGAVTPLQALDIRDAQAEGSLEPFSDHYFTDTRIKTDLSRNKKLAYSLTFSDITSFSGLPAEFDQNELIEWGKYPGLGIDILHKHGYDGTGSVIAYIDQPAATHAEYQGLNIHFTNNTNSRSSMHGPAVLSFLAGKNTGTAPGAEVYFYGHASWKADQTTHSECLYQIIEQNKKLPEDKKIRMVGFSDNPDSREKNLDAFQKAIKECEDSGVMVWFCGDYSSATFAAEADRNNPDNLYPAGWGSSNPKLVYVPAGGRTSADNDCGGTYIYWSDGGLSWTMPYALGVYSIGMSIDPTLTRNDIETLIVSTATTNANGMRVINPVEFVATVLERVGKNTEAASLRLDYKNSFHYLYAVMDKNKMTSADISAAEDYLRSIKGVTVLEVDASMCTSSSSLYATLKNDAAERGGIIDGIQIFGTPDAVPAFDVTYKVQMPSDIDEGGTVKSDLFYGNFKNEVSDIGSSYSVYDHFKNGKNITLTPDRPVVRLPLKSGQYASYFAKYDDFALKTRYGRLPLVNFSNPIFAASYHIDDMSHFLDRCCNEFKILDKNGYRLYANKLGQYPVENKGLLGGFTADNLTAENRKGVVEFLINSHGQRNNIDKCWFENNKEKRESLINSDTINSVLSDNPYYLDCWTCNNGWGMDDNLTTKALTGNCVGMFSATAVISNNGVNCRASLSDMQKSNFYWFYYSYLKSLAEDRTRAAAFFEAQKAYADALIADSANGIRGEGNYQFNLYNLFEYENFGIIEPGTFLGLSEAYNIRGTDVTIVAGQKINLKETCFSSVSDTVSRYKVSDRKKASVSKDMLTGLKPGTITVTAQKKISRSDYKDFARCTVTVLNKPGLKFNTPMTYSGQEWMGPDFFTASDTSLLGATLWESSKPSVVEITDPTTGALTARGNGSARITAYFGEKGKPGTFKVSAGITVKTPAFQKSEYSIQTGAKMILSMKNVNAATGATWSTDKPNLATATAQKNTKGVETGKVIIEGLAYGDTTLTAVIDGHEYSTIIHVAAPQINKETMTIRVNKSGALSLKNTRIKKTDIKWETSDPSVALVDNNGKVYGISSGYATISTDAGGYHNECKVTVW